LQKKLNHSTQFRLLITSMPKTILVCSSCNTTVGNYYIGMLNIFVNDFGWKAIFLSDTDTSELNASDDHIQYMSWPNNNAKSLKAVLFFSKLIIKVKPTIVLSNFSSTVICTLLAKIFGIKRVLNHYHTPAAQLKLDGGVSFFQVHLRRMILNLNDEIIAASFFVKNDLNDFWKLRDDQIMVIPFLLDAKLLMAKTQGFSSMNHDIASNDKISFFYPGRLYSSKGHVEFIENIFIPIYQRNKNVILIINGIGPLEKKIRQFVNDNGLDEAIVFQSPTTYSEYLFNIKNSTFCCGLSLAEGFGLVFLEMLAMGAIPITRNISPMNEFIPNDLGILLNDQNYQEVVEKVLSLIANKKIYDQQRDDILQYFSAQYDIRSHGHEYAHLIKGAHA
jgi:glycosyltransferase involved in cell wall biosynthesis